MIKDYGFFHDYPYTNFHEMNLDWILNQMIELRSDMKNFVNENTIKYADPIQWNISSQYEANTVVIDPASGTAYLSTQPVPSGININNEDYWTKIMELSGLVDTNITDRDDGYSALATFTSEIGDWLLWNGILYKVIRDINTNEAYLSGYNIEEYTVEKFLNDAIDDLNEQIQSITSNISNALHIYDNVAELIADDKLEAGDYAFCLGYYAGGDGGDGTFKISDVAEGFHHTLSNGLFANNKDNDIKLPRYGGMYVSEMVDNAREFIPYHGMTHVILPQPNGNHPACRYYVENGMRNYFWVTDQPVIYDEHYAYTINDFYGNIMLDKDSTNTRAVFVVSDANKPEDIYFNNLMVEGWHVGGATNYPNAALLVEGCARLNIQNLGAGYAAHSVLLGGSDVNNTIEMNVDYAELGSCTIDALRADSSKTTIFRCGNMQIENIFASAGYGICANGAGSYKWKIEDISMAFNANPANFTPVFFSGQYTTFDLGIEIGRLRCGSSGTGHQIHIGGSKSINTVGVMQSGSPSENIFNAGTQTYLLIDSYNRTAHTQEVTITNIGTNAKTSIKDCNCLVNQSGANIYINGVATGSISNTEQFGIFMTSGNQLQVKYNGVNHTIV